MNLSTRPRPCTPWHQGTVVFPLSVPGYVPAGRVFFAFGEGQAPASGESAPEDELSGSALVLFRIFPVSTARALPEQGPAGSLPEIFFKKIFQCIVIVFGKKLSDILSCICEECSIY